MSLKGHLLVAANPAGPPAALFGCLCASSDVFLLLFVCSEREQNTRRVDDERSLERHTKIVIPQFWRLDIRNCE